MSLVRHFISLKDGYLFKIHNEQEARKLLMHVLFTSPQDVMEFGLLPPTPNGEETELYALDDDLSLTVHYMNPGTAIIHELEPQLARLQCQSATGFAYENEDDIEFNKDIWKFESGLYLYGWCEPGGGCIGVVTSAAGVDNVKYQAYNVGEVLKFMKTANERHMDLQELIIANEQMLEARIAAIEAV